MTRNNYSQKTNHILFIFLIAIIITSPCVFFFPKLVSIKVFSAEKNLKINFRNNYGLKNKYITANKHIRDKIFQRQLIPDRAIDLKNGWYVIGDAFSNALSESKGLIIFSKKELEQIKKNLIKKKQWLLKKNISFYVSIAPNKLTVYDTLVPIHGSNTTKLKQLDSLCKSINVNFINLGTKFKDYGDLQLYHKTDTHWNENGALLGYLESIELIKKDFPNYTFKKFDIRNLKHHTTDTLLSDLLRILKKEKNENFIHITLDTINAKITHKKLPIPEKYKNLKTAPSLYEKRYINHTKKLKFLAFRDSFFDYCDFIYAESFGESLFIWDHFFDKEIINKESPDIVFFEIVERNIDLLLEE